MDTTDITDGSITAPMNFDAVENFEVITGGLDAQYNALGMIENAVTKNGSNRLTYDASLVAVHVSSLRRKLEAHGPRLIHTERGRGYVVRA